MNSENSKIEVLLEQLAPVVLPPAEFPPADIVRDTDREELLERIETNASKVDISLTDEHWKVINFLFDFYTDCCEANEVVYKKHTKYWEYIDCIRNYDCKHELEGADEASCQYGILSRKEAIKAYRVYRILLKAFEEQGGKKHLYTLFPYGPVFTIHLLAQLPRLVGDVDPHLGTAY